MIRFRKFPCLRKTIILWAVTVIGTIIITAWQCGSLTIHGVFKCFFFFFFLHLVFYVDNRLTHPDTYRNWVALADAPVYRKTGDKYVLYYIAEKSTKVRIEAISLNDGYILLTDGGYLSFDETSYWEMSDSIIGTPYWMILFKEITEGKHPDLKVEDAFAL